MENRETGWVKWAIMGGFLLGVVSFLLLTLQRVKIDAGFEAVLIDKPFWTAFGKGGVRPEPLTAGAKWLWYTTEVVTVDLRPFQWTERFDDKVDGTITSDNVPIDFNAYIKTRPVDSRTPELVARFGPDWYNKNLKEYFRTEVRDEVVKHPMTALTTRQDVLAKVQADVKKSVEDFVKKEELPIVVMEVIIGKAAPPDTIVAALADTAAQQQRAKTEDERAKAEINRKHAEANRAKADNAYREAIGLSPAQFLQLEGYKAYVEAAKQCSNSSKGCTMVVGEPGVIPTIAVR